MLVLSNEQMPQSRRKRSIDHDELLPFELDVPESSCVVVDNAKYESREEEERTV